MKRLQSKLVTSALVTFKRKRLIRTAEWVDIDSSDPNLVQDITNLMASGGQMQILYNDGEWKTISPYGWNSSKDGNVLLMCYKDTGEVRSYRFDRIESTKIDSNDLERDTSEDEFDKPVDNEDSGFDLPPDEDSIQEQDEESKDLPFNDAIDALDNEDGYNDNEDDIYDDEDLSIEEDDTEEKERAK